MHDLNNEMFKQNLKYICDLYFAYIMWEDLEAIVDAIDMADPNYYKIGGDNNG